MSGFKAYRPCMWTPPVPLAAAAIYTSAKALKARDERSFWLMFKASSPILAAFLILLMAAP